MADIMLRECPFCGGEAELCFGGQGSEKAHGMSFVRCKNCGSIGKKFILSPDYASNVKAASTWNNRFNEEGSMSDVCDGCKFTFISINAEPCASCKRNHEDNWRAI